MAQRGTREASHADSWYDGDPTSLTQQLDDFLADVPSSVDNHNDLPISGAKVIIAP